MVNFKLRNGRQSDKEWLYNLYCRTMRSCIEATWGWNEEFQADGFSLTLHQEPLKLLQLSSKT